MANSAFTVLGSSGNDFSELLDNQNISGGSSIVIKNINNSYRNAILLLNVSADSDPQTLYMQMSSDNGVTWKNTLNAYACTTTNINTGSSSIASATNDVQLILSNSTKFTILTLNITNIGLPFTTGYAGTGWGHDLSGPLKHYGYNVFGNNTGGSNINAFKLYMSSGNITGETWLYGLLPRT